MRYILPLTLLLCFSVVQAQNVNTSIKDFGAVGDGITDDTKAVQEAIDYASENKLKIRFTSGTYMTGMIHLKSNVEIELEQGATWQAIPDLDLYPEIKSNADLSQKGGYTMSRRAFIWGDNIENVVLSGNGTIYPSGDEHKAFPMMEENGSKRPYGIYFRNSKNILVKNLHLRNSAFWMLRFFLCTDVRVTGIDLYNHANTNNDGIDIVDCHRVVVSDCVIDSSDDALCLKTEAPFGTADVVINNCILSSTASALKFGTGSFGFFKRIVASNIVIRPTRAPKVIHNLQVPEGITGIGIMSVDGADIQDLRFSNISIKGTLAPIFIRLNKRHKTTHTEYNDVVITPGTINGIHFSDISASDCGPISANIAGYPGHYVENISFNNVQLGYGKKGDKADISKQVPENDKGYPNPMMYGMNLPSFGLYFRHVRNVILTNVSLISAIDEPRKSIFLEDVHNLNAQNILTDFKKTNSEAIATKNCTSIVVN
ncbi:MAG: glycoside hydrolase family 28 protein [Maribacter sp.]